MDWSVRVLAAAVPALCAAVAACGGHSLAAHGQAPLANFPARSAGTGGAGNQPPKSGGEGLGARALIELAAKEPNGTAFREALTATLGENRIKNGTAVTGEGPDFLWAIEASSQPKLILDDQPGPEMKRIEGSDLWFAVGKLAIGRGHGYLYIVDGKPVGGDVNLPAYGPDSYEQPGVPQGTLSPMITHTSKIYEGMVTHYWVYVPAGYDPKAPAAVMVWNDGQGHVNRNGGSRTQNVIDNLINQKKIPVMIQVFVQPGEVPDPGGGRPRAMRSIEYDTVTDRYDRFLRDEILAEVGGEYNLRKDSYSRGIAGESSGAIAAFNAAWQMPELFSRVLSRIGSYTSIQWHPGELDGGNIFPFAIRKTPRKNIRIWLSDGCEDLENVFGSWPLQNLQMANSLKMQEYDFHFSFGPGSHNGAQGSAEAPASLTWLWRDYDPGKTEQAYEQEAAERAKPYFRVHVYSRDH